MTEQRLKIIMDEVAIDEGYTNWGDMYQKSFIFPERVVKAMKQAVNEAIQECADSLTGLSSVNHNTSLILGGLKHRNRKKILNMKVK